MFNASSQNTSLVDNYTFRYVVHTVQTTTYFFPLFYISIFLPFSGNICVYEVSAAAIAMTVWHEC